MKWKVIRDIDSIPKNAVLRQINHGFNKSTLVSLSKTSNAKNKFVVLEYLGSQKILKIGTDVIPYSYGVRD